MELGFRFQVSGVKSRPKMEKVWISDPHEGFVLGRIVDLTDEGALVARLDKSRKEESVSFDRLYSAEADDQVSVSQPKP